IVCILCSISGGSRDLLSFPTRRSSDLLLFPSRLETWGLPLTEFSTTQKPIFAANLPYAHETLGGHHNAHFFNPEDSTQLARLMENLVRSTLPTPATVPTIEPDFTSWEALFDHIFA